MEKDEAQHQFDRRRADAEFRMRIDGEIDDLHKAVAQVGVRIDGMEREQLQRHRDNAEQLTKINAALFDEHGNSRLSEMLDILRASKFGAALVKFLAAVAASAAVVYGAMRGIKG